MIASVQSAKVKKDWIDSPRIFDDTVIKEFKLCLMGKGIEESIVCSNNQLEELILGHMFWKGYLSSAAELQIVDWEETEDKATVKIEVLNRKDSAPAQEKAAKANSEKFTFPMDLRRVMELSEEMLTSNELFDKTGALHSCVISTAYGEKQFSAVDLGRHNAIDKAIGAALKEKTDLSKCVLFTTGRVPADMLSKVIAAGIPMMVSRGAVTMQAVSLARKEGIILCGFSRGERLNIYAPQEYLTEKKEG